MANVSVTAATEGESNGKQDNASSGNISDFNSWLQSFNVSQALIDKMKQIDMDSMYTYILYTSSNLM